MAEHRGENKIVLRGAVAAPPAFSHRNHGTDYSVVPLRVPRLSGAEDLVNLITANPDLEVWAPGRWVEAEGEVRSYNNRTGVGSRLVITVLVRAVRQTQPDEGENRLILSGVLCKAPVRRRTPLGREICDLLLAVNRSYGRADYLPCIAWGSLAVLCGGMETGDSLRLEGRLQSRQYRKMVDGQETIRTAYEVSVMNLLPPLEEEVSGT